MNIAVDIQPLCTGSATRGMGVYTLGLLRGMFAQDRENEYYIFNFYGDCALDSEELPPNVHYKKIYPGVDACLLTNIVFLLTHEMGMRYNSLVHGVYQSFIKENNIDVFFITSPIDNHMAYQREWFSGAKTACIFYDLVPYLFQEKYNKDEYALARYTKLLDFVCGCDLLLAISQSAKEDIVEYMGVGADRVKVIHAGVSGGFEAADFSDEAVEAALFKYSVSGEFMLFPSGNDFRKNASRTVYAYCRLPKEIIEKYQLVISGAPPQDEMDIIAGVLEASGINGRVVFTGHVPHEDMLLLYNKCSLVLFPSLYEGFGLPVIEAFKCGKNVVTSDNSSLGEVARGAAVLVDPYSEDGIARGIIEGLSLDEQSFGSTKRERIAFYTWERSARLAVQAISGMAQPSRKTMRTRKKIAYFSPMQPISSPVAVYSELLLPALREYCDVDIFVDGGYRPRQYLHVMRHSLFPKLADSYDAVIYQLADNRYNTYMLPYLIEFGGVAVMHDINLNSSVYAALAGQKALYSAFLSREISGARQAVLKMAKNNLFASALLDEIELNRFALHKAQKIIVNNEKDRLRLMEKNAGYCIRCIETGRSANAMADVARGYYDFIFGPSRSYMSDADIYDICRLEIVQRKLGDVDGEVRKLSETLSYVVLGNE